MIERLIAVRQDDLPDRFKYIRREGISIKANAFELAEQAYSEIINSNNEDTIQRFETSYERFKEIYLGLIKPKKLDSDVSQVKEITFPEIPDTFMLERVTEQEVQQKTNTNIVPKLSNRNYYLFKGNELTTLQFLIPEHKKKPDFIPAIGGIVLDIVMRAGLAKQISIIKESSDIRIRTARKRFILKGQRIFAKATAAIEGEEIGRIFDPHDGFSGHTADPLTIDKEIHKELEVYKKELVINEDCKLSGSELTEAFFKRLFKLLECSLARELKELQEEYEKNKIKISFFDKKRLISEYKQNQECKEDKYHQYITEMKKFKRIVEQFAPENMMIFAAEDGKASFTLPKDALINDGIASAGFTPIAPR